VVQLIVFTSPNPVAPEEAQPSASGWDNFSRTDSNSWNPGKNTSNTVAPAEGRAGYIPEAAVG
jgi:hypothetical protein